MKSYAESFSFPSSMQPSSLTESRQRDLWMTHVARAILGKEPATCSDISRQLADTQDEPPTSSHKISQDEIQRIQRLVQQYLPCSADKTSESTQQILRLCAENAEPYSYDIVICADLMMKTNDVADCDRIARVVCDRMCTIYDALNEEQHNTEDPASNHVRMLRFSLCRVLTRFCKDSDYYPESLFLKDITVTTDCIGSGSATDVYSAQSSSGQRLAVKTYRVFEREQGAKRFSEDLVFQSILLSQLTHPNILQSLGVYRQSYEKLQTTALVFPWMEHRDVLHCMGKLRHDAIPRTRWIYEVACGLRYLHDEGVVHGNLHASNILIDSDMHVHIASFGLSTVEEDTTSAQITLEASSWSAPELSEEGAMPNYASDAWAFGCACLLIWTGEGPYSTCLNLLQLGRLLDKPTSTPENAAQPMDSFYQNEPEVHRQGTIIRSEVALPCWSREPEDRPSMNKVEDILGTISDCPGADARVCM